MNGRLLRGLLPLLAVALAAPAHADWFGREAAIMGTLVRVELWHQDPLAGEAAIDAVLDEFRRIDRLMSPYHDQSELALLNRAAADRPVAVGDELYTLLKESRRISELTEGAFDITFASVGHQYDYRNRIAPSPEALARDLAKIDYRHVVLDPATRSVRFARPGVRIDLGGIAKGYAVDRGIALLQARAITHALISAGGDSRLLGDHRGRPWHIGVRAPRDRSAMAAVLPLAESAVSTSGDYERYFEADGVRHHHILTPTTGRSASELQSVTLIGPDATRTDALATSVFVLGPSAGLALVDRLPGFEAVLIDRDGRMRYSAGLERIGAAADRP